MFDQNLYLAILWTIASATVFGNILVRVRDRQPFFKWCICLGLDISCAVMYYMQYFAK